MMTELKVIARMRSDFPTKSGIPRQSGLVDELRSTIVFEPEFRVSEALRGLEAYSHLWLIWGFSETARESWHATVRPPRLGGNVRMGVFATRSPFRPNPLGLSSVRLAGLEVTSDRGTVIHVCGADLMDGTPIFDIKPYLSFTDAHPEAVNGFADAVKGEKLRVIMDEALVPAFDPEQREALRAVLAQDPRPAYHNDPERVYGFNYSGYDVQFRVVEGDLIVLGIVPLVK